jgi:enoyl-[acyl-carrier-protein] reductase (NADH)
VYITKQKNLKKIAKKLQKNFKKLQKVIHSFCRRKKVPDFLPGAFGEDDCAGRDFKGSTGALYSINGVNLLTWA